MQRQDLPSATARSAASPVAGVTHDLEDRSHVAALLEALRERL